jgi:hypothetical protein
MSPAPDPLSVLIERLGTTSVPKAPRRQPHELVVIVHGTFANPEFPEYPKDKWWSSFGSFAKVLDAALERHSSRARCSEPFDYFARREDPVAIWTGWSGANSEVERRKGAQELATYLRSLQDNDDIFGFHIVAHSHGGNVVRRAFRYMNEPTTKLGRVVCLGTPFLHFHDRAFWRRWFSRVHWPMLIVLAGLIGVTWWRREWLERSENALAFYWLTALIGATLFALWRFGRSTQVSSVDVPMTALRFSHDEAIQLLRSCAAFVATPHLLLRDVLGGTAVRRERRTRPRRRGNDWIDKALVPVTAVGRAIWNGFAFCSDVWNRPVCGLAERLTTGLFRLPILGSIAGGLGTLALIMMFRPYRPPLRPLFTTRLPRLRTLFHQTLHQQFEDDHRERLKKAENSTLWDAVNDSFIGPKGLLGFAAFLPVVLYWLAIYPVDKVLGVFPWLGAVATRFFIVLGARAAAAGAPGMDMFGAAFDARRTGEAPDRTDVITVPDAIESDLEKTLDGRMRVDLSPFRRALDPARNVMLLDAVKTVFTDPALLHSQYYQDERIVDYIAALIAQPRETPLWQVTPAAATVPATAAPEPT